MLAMAERFEVTIVSAPGDGVAPSLLIAAPKCGAQYLVNVPEGFSRLALEHRIRPSAKLSCVLLTSTLPEAAGGLGALILRLAQDGHGQTQLVGPAGTAAYAHALRHIFHWRHPKLFCSECTESTPVFEDEHVLILPLLAGDNSLGCPACATDCSREDVRACSTSSSDTDSSSGSDSDSSEQESRRPSRCRTLASRLDAILKTKPNKLQPQAPSSTTSEFKWLVHNGKLDELPDLDDGCNPLYCKEQTGRISSMRSENIGKKNGPSTSRAVLGYFVWMKVLGAGVVVADVHDTAAVACLESHSVFHCRTHGLQGVAAVVYLSPSGKRSSWLSSSGASEIMVGGSPLQYGFIASLETMVKLNLVDEAAFPLPAAEDLSTEDNCRLLSKVILERRLSGVHVEMDHSDCGSPLNLKQMKEQFLQSRPDVKQVLANRKTVQNLDSEVLSPNQIAAAAMKRSFTPQVSKVQVPKAPSSFELLFLGTGCAEPSKYRGSSGILVQLEAGSSILLDAGEGVLGQMRKKLGEEATSRTLTSLQCIWISHKHADHVLGLVSVIRSRQHGSAPLVIIGCSKVQYWLGEVADAYVRSGNPLPKFDFVRSKEAGILQRQADSSEEANPLQEVLRRLELTSLVNVPVEHCYDACGLVLHGENGWSLVYSGDTRPCQRLVQAGAGCTLLIHEATFEDCLENHARAKRHSTVSEALQIGQQMRAQYVVLTHFSQRYAKVVEVDTARYPRACIAFDGMVVSSSSLSCLKDLQPVVNLVLRDVVRRKRPKENGSRAKQELPSNPPEECECVPPRRKHIRWDD